MVKSIIAYACSALTAMVGAAAADEVTRAVYLVLGAVSCAVTLALNVWDFVRKIKDAKADGIITDEERKAIEDEAKKAIEDLKKQIEEMRKGEGE